MRVRLATLLPALALAAYPITGMVGNAQTRHLNADVTHTHDPDGDGVPTHWERAFGFNPFSATDSTTDPDGDGATNAQEFAAGTHPTGLASATRYFAEGSTGSFFGTWIELANPSTSPATVLLRFLKPGGASATTVVSLPARESRTVAVATVPGMENTAFATVVESNVVIVADRTMNWSDGIYYGSHAERSGASPGTTWYLAEGATHSGFDLFYLFVNPSASTAEVRVRYLLPTGPPLERTYTVAANSRFNVWVDQESFGGVPRLASTDVSAVIEVQNGVPILVERAMYLTPNGGLPFTAGHASAAVSAPAPSWLLAEGSTGPYFDEFVLVSNPGNTAATVRATYLLASGATYTKDYAIPASSRFNIWVDEETIPGAGKALANVALSVRLDVVNGPNVVVERSMWWPGSTWHETHNVIGATNATARWGFAEGTVDTPVAATDCYFLIANPNASPATVKVTLLFDGSPETSKTYVVPPTTRHSVDVRAEFPTAIGRTFGALVESQGTSPVPVVAERAVYRDALGVRWAAGSAALGTPLP